MWSPNAAGDGRLLQEMQRPRIPLAIAAFLFVLVFASTLFSGGDSPPPPPSPQPSGGKVAVKFYSEGASHRRTHAQSVGSHLIYVWRRTALSSDCRKAFDSLNSTFMHADGVFEIATFELIPWGRSYYGGGGDKEATWSQDSMTAWLGKCTSTPVPADCWSGTLLCENGAEECTANLMQSCTIHISSELGHSTDSLPMWWDFIACVEHNIDVGKNVSVSDAACRKYLATGFSQLALDDCYKKQKDEGEYSTLRSQAATATSRLSPPHSGTAYILVDGQKTDADEVLTKVCDRYKGPESKKPAACKKRSL